MWAPEQREKGGLRPRSEAWRRGADPTIGPEDRASVHLEEGAVTQGPGLQGGVVGGQAGPTGVACWEAYNSDTSKPHIQFWSLDV